MSDDVSYFHVIEWTMSDDEHRAAWLQWYETTHVAGLLAVPGMRRVTRYTETDSPDSYISIWEIDGPEVLETEEYAAARGWGPWAPYMGETRVSLLERHRPQRRIPAGGVVDSR